MDLRIALQAFMPRFLKLSSQGLSEQDPHASGFTA